MPKRDTAAFDGSGLERDPPGSDDRNLRRDDDKCGVSPVHATYELGIDVTFWKAAA